MKQVLVAGANKGIGLAIVEAILREQPEYGVILGSRDLQRGRRALDRLLETDTRWAGRVQLLELDVANDASVNMACEQLREISSGSELSLQGLVNNAGLGSGSLADILNVNVTGIQRMCRAFAPLMPAGARIVNVTSAAGPNFVARCDEARAAFFLDEDMQWEQLEELMAQCKALEQAGWSSLGMHHESPYALSKACANSLTQILARSHPQLRVNACTPGFIETDLGREFLGGRTPAEAGMKTPAEGARVILFLLFGEPVATGHYYGSDALRSPMDRYRAPGSPAYTGD